jgi:hypothetical protein
MKFRLYQQFGALNSPPVFNAFKEGIKSSGHSLSNDADAIPVIWSVLWLGRMAPNEMVYKEAIKKNIPVVIIEVSNFNRGQTWRISKNNINRLGQFGNDESLDADRPKKLNLLKFPKNMSRKSNILITTQHSKSLQWHNVPPTTDWINLTIKKIKQFTDRPIIVRPHPRALVKNLPPGVSLEVPKKIPNTYDDFDLRFDYHCIINHNSGPTVQAAYRGCPIICDSSCMAFDMSEAWQDLDSPKFPGNKDDWLLKMSHTEWTVDEISKGIPIMRLFPN